MTRPELQSYNPQPAAAENAQQALTVSPTAMFVLAAAERGVSTLITNTLPSQAAKLTEDVTDAIPTFYPQFNKVSVIDFNEVELSPCSVRHELTATDEYDLLAQDRLVIVNNLDTLIESPAANHEWAILALFNWTNGRGIDGSSHPSSNKPPKVCATVSQISPNDFPDNWNIVLAPLNKYINRG